MLARETDEKDLFRVLEEVRRELGRISSKLDKIIEMDERVLQHITEAKGVYKEGSELELGEALDVMTLLSLPDHLRKTAMVMCKVNGATANDVAVETKRARAVESSYLNQLVTMGHVKKRRKGRKVYFYIER